MKGEGKESDLGENGGQNEKIVSSRPKANCFFRMCLGTTDCFFVPSPMQRVNGASLADKISIKKGSD